MSAFRVSLVRRLAWGATLALGFGTAWMFVLILLATWVQEAWRVGDSSPVERLVVRSDGTLLVQSYPTDHPGEWTFRDLEGRPQVAPDHDDQIPAVYLSGEPRKAGYFTTRPDWNSRMKPFLNEKAPDINWFFVYDGKPDGAGYFVAYDRPSKRRIGFLGMSGFHAEPVPPADWIPVHGLPASSVPLSIYSNRWSMNPGLHDIPPRWAYAPAGNVLRKVDLAARSVTTVLEDQEPIVAVGVPGISSWYGGSPTKERTVLVRTTHQIQELDRNDHAAKVFTIPSGVDRQSQVEWYELENGQAIAVIDMVRPTGEENSLPRRMVYRISSDRTIQNEFELHLQFGSSGPGQPILALETGLSVPSPVMLSGLALLFGTESGPPQNS